MRLALRWQLEGASDVLVVSAGNLIVIAAWIKQILPRRTPMPGASGGDRSADQPCSREWAEKKADEN